MNQILTPRSFDGRFHRRSLHEDVAGPLADRGTCEMTRNGTERLDRAEGHPAQPLKKATEVTEGGRGRRGASWSEVRGTRTFLWVLRVKIRRSSLGLDSALFTMFPAPRTADSQMLFQSPFIHEDLSGDLKRAIGCLGYPAILGL